MWARVMKVSGKRMTAVAGGSIWGRVWGALLSGPVKHLATAAATVVACAVVAQVWEVRYVIAPFHVPESLAKAGLDGDSVADIVRDRVATMVVASRTATGPDLEIRIRQPEEKDFDLKVAGTELPIRSLAAGIARQFGLAPLEITGSIWTMPGLQADVGPAGQVRYRIALRRVGGGEKPLLDSDGTLDAVLTAASLEVLGTVDPVSRCELSPDGRPGAAGRGPRPRS